MLGKFTFPAIICCFISIESLLFGYTILLSGYTILLI